MAEETIIAYCGMVCSKCGAYLKGRCKGCHSDKPMNRNCKVRKCAMERQISTCADCKDFDNLRQCKKLNNFVSKIFAIIFRSNRIGNLERIAETGFDNFKAEQ